MKSLCYYATINTLNSCFISFYDSRIILAMIILKIKKIEKSKILEIWAISRWSAWAMAIASIGESITDQVVMF